MMHVKPTELARVRMFSVANRIEPMGRDLFNLGHWAKEDGLEDYCRTPSCIAGHATWLSRFKMGPERMRPEELRLASRQFGHPDVDYRQEAAEWFRLDYDHSIVLFVPTLANLFDGCLEPVHSHSCDEDARHRVSGGWAAATLRHLADTGVVDWTRFKPPSLA